MRWARPALAARWAVRHCVAGAGRAVRPGRLEPARRARSRSAWSPAPLVTWLDAARRGDRTESGRRRRIAARAPAGNRRALPARGARARSCSPTPTGRSRAGAVEQRIERELAAVLGAASARLLLDAARREQGRDLDTVATHRRRSLAGAALQPARARGRAGEHEPGHQRGRSPSCAWWRGTAATRNCSTIPEPLLQVGVPVSRPAARTTSRTKRARRRRGDSRGETCKRIAHMRAGTPYVAERRFRRQPWSRSAATRCRAAASSRPSPTSPRSAAPRPSSRASPKRWSSASIARTAELEGAKGDAERANRAKTPLPRRGQPRPGAAAQRRAPVHPRAGAATRAHAAVPRGGRQHRRRARFRRRPARRPAGYFAARRRRHVAATCRRSASTSCCSTWPTEFGVLARQKGLRAATTCRRAPGCAATRSCCAACCRTSSPMRCATPRSGRILLGCRRRGDALRDRSVGHRPGHRRSRPAA